MVTFVLKVWYLSFKICSKQVSIGCTFCLKPDKQQLHPLGLVRPVFDGACTPVYVQCRSLLYLGVRGGGGGGGRLVNIVPVYRPFGPFGLFKN